jgi:hypothetical protein
MKKKFIGILCIAAVLSILVSCGGGSPESVAKSFMNAMLDGKFDKAAKYATEESGKMLMQLQAMAAMGGDMGELTAMESDGGSAEKPDIKITGSEIDGDNATVTYEMEGQPPQEMTLVKENGKWKVLFEKEEGMMMDKEA